MNSEHPSEQDLQLLLTGELPGKTGVLQHVQSCPFCQQQIAAYQEIIQFIEKSAAATFDFDVESAVLQQIQPLKPIAVKKHYYQVVTGAVVAIIVAATLYLFRHYFLNLSAGISSLFLAISLTACISIIVFEVIKLYLRYDRQLKKLDFS